MKINFLFNDRFKVCFFIYFIIITTASLYIFKFSNVVIADLTLKSDYKLKKNFDDVLDMEIQRKLRKFLYENVNSEIILNNYKKNTIKSFDFNKSVYGKSIVIKLKFENSFDKREEKNLIQFIKDEIKIFQLSQIDNFTKILKSNLINENNGNMVNIEAFYSAACFLETSYCLKDKRYTDLDSTKKKILFNKISSDKNVSSILTDKFFDSFIYDIYINKKYARLFNENWEHHFASDYFDVEIKDYTGFNKIILFLSYIFFLLIPFFIKRFND